jgi:hypothetical protein
MASPGLALIWRWRSGRSLGRPRLNSEVRALIATMARENPHWGTERIRGELLKLGIAVSARSITSSTTTWGRRIGASGCGHRWARNGSGSRSAR